MKWPGIRIITLALVLCGVSAPMGAVFFSEGARAQEVEQTVNLKKEKADQFLDQGIQQFNVSQFREALQSWEQALSLYQEIGDRQGEANSLGNLGLAFRNLGLYQKAIEFHQKSLAIKTDIGNRLGEAASLGNLGIAYDALGQYQKAIEFHQKSLAILQEIGDRRGEGASLGNLGLAYSSLGEYQKAINFYQQALAIAKEIGDRQGEGNSLGNLGNAYYSLGEYQKAIKFHQQSLAILKEIGDRYGIATLFNSTGVSYENLNQYPQAEENLYSSINHWELLRQKLKDASQISIFDTHIHAYRNLQRVLLAQEKNSAALVVSERGRSRALIQLLARSFPQASQQLTIELPNIELFKTVAQQQNATLVEYSLLSNQALVIWVITPAGEIHMEKVPLTDLNTSIETLAQNNRLWLEKARGSDTTETEISKILRGNQTIAFNPNTNTPPQTSQDTLKKLHQHLIEPIAQHLPKTEEERVIFISHRSLFQVPFAALMDDEDNYLIHSHTIHTAPSIHSLLYTQLHQERVSNQAQEVLIVGNPTIPSAANESNSSNPLAQLEGTEKEAYGIAKQIKGASPLIGNQATETEVKRRLHQARLIHFATHGVFSDKDGNPIQGYIVLAESKADGDDGLLTVGEIIELTQGKLLNAEMIVLSACETGVGDIRGEGVVGLSRALIAAGVPSVVVSLWNVEDESTSLLMQYFYSNLLEKKMDKATALRHAMLKVSEDYPDPKHWAAFTLIGEAE